MESACAGTPRDCSDGIVCNGEETCNEDADACDMGMTTCTDGEMCDTATDMCICYWLNRRGRSLRRWRSQPRSQSNARANGIGVRGRFAIAAGDVLNVMVGQRGASASYVGGGGSFCAGTDRVDTPGAGTGNGQVIIEVY